ncbi:4-aminobutyrate--2-oxoglutarate transaminase [Dermatophilus congolensis]|uniref:4-aminobutyrate--2-oxoglutarate transaminase n=1 Tax=Dermatophilus congolensis TaxID=1863 RepID=UPI000E0FCCF5|nr:4-aminobutyrate--2-oxoglutarate transaminase [Dermatophilus congolensis]
MTSQPRFSSEVVQERRLVTEVPGPRSRQMHERTCAAVSAGVGVGLPVYVERAGGGVLVDVDGNHLIDFGSGIAVTSVGNSDARVVAAAAEQLERFTHTCFMVTPYEAYTQVCEMLNEVTPGSHPKRSALFNSGAEAVENAVKIARVFTGRDAVVVFDHAYHGRTNLTMALTAKNMPYKQGFGPFAGEVYRMPMAYPYRWSGPAESMVQDAFEAFESAVHAQVGESNVAAVVIEPIQGEGGFIVPPPGWMAKIAQWCKQHGVVFVADEVQTGFCRTGDWFACQAEQVVPDLITTAKGIAGGLPLSAVTGRAEMMDAVHAGGLGGTYGGNPVACAAALGAVATMREEDLAGRARCIGSILQERLEGIAAGYGVIGDIRGRGAMMAVEIVKPGTKTPDPQVTKRISAACHAAGVVTLTAGTYGNALRFLPPLVIGEDLLREGLDVLEQAFADVVAAS